MDINFNSIAVDLYGTLQTRFPNVKIGDETGEVLSKKEDIPEARFFEFPFKEQGKVLGTITITLDDDDGVVLQLGGDLVNRKVPGVLGFIRQMRGFANGRLLDFKIINLEKSNLDKRDYEFQAKRKEPNIMPPVTPVMESKFYGTSKISYQDLGEARIVIKHSQPVNLDLAAGRTMHIESIYVENADGERFKYPFKHLNGARALAEHLKHGGNPYDPIGKHITGLSEELAQLRKFKGYVGRNEALAEAMGDIQTRVMERIEQVKDEVQKLQRKSYYEEFAESYEEREVQEIPEAVMDDWIDRLTVRTFNEDLKTAFPYIFKLVDESEIPVKEINPDDLLDEVFDGDKETGTTHKGGKVEKTKHGLKHTKTDYEDGNGERGRKPNPDGTKSRYDQTPILDPEDAFESFINRIAEDAESQDGEDTLFSPNAEVQHAAVQKLNQLMSSDLKSGGNAMNAKLSLKGIIDDPEFFNAINQLDPDLDIRALLQQYVQAKDPAVAMQLDFGNEQTGGEEPVATPPAPEVPPAPAPEVPPEAAAPAAAPEQVPPAAPVAEGVETAKLKAKFIKAKECGATLETTMDFGHREMTLLDVMRECGINPMECGFGDDEAEEPIAPEESGIEQILKSIAGFWNKEAHNFTIGGTRAKQKVVKAFKDGEYPNATEEDVKAVLHKIEEMDPSSSEHESVVKLAGLPHMEIDVVDHRPAAMSAKVDSMDPLARLIQLTK